MLSLTSFLRQNRAFSRKIGKPFTFMAAIAKFKISLGRNFGHKRVRKVFKHRLLVTFLMIFLNLFKEITNVKQVNTEDKLK